MSLGGLKTEGGRTPPSLLLVSGIPRPWDDQIQDRCRGSALDELAASCLEERVVILVREGRCWAPELIGGIAIEQPVYSVARAVRRCVTIPELDLVRGTGGDTSKEAIGDGMSSAIRTVIQRITT